MREISILEILIVIMLLCPIVILITPYHIAVSGMSWTLSIVMDEVYFDFGPLLVVQGLPLTFLRVAFVLMVHRYYRGQTTKVRTLIVGALAEFQVPLSFFLLQFAYPFPIVWFLPIVPIPILFLTAIYLIQSNPVPASVLWDG